jgi:protein-S-isoprenylcysteine O-methyltransferase Ste14
MMQPSTLFAASWGLWALSWIVAALWSGPTLVRRTPAALACAYGLIAGSVLIPLAWHLARLPSLRFWDVGATGAIVLALATIPGFAFAWWARLHLGLLWSAEIVARPGHRLVQSGPYGLVRHPIYTGILWAALVTDIASANVPSALSFACLLLGFWLKASLEEDFLTGLFNPGAYAAYRRRVPMLVPSPFRSKRSRP